MDKLEADKIFLKIQLLGKNCWNHTEVIFYTGYGKNKARALMNECNRHYGAPKSNKSTLVKSEAIIKFTGGNSREEEVKIWKEILLASQQMSSLQESLLTQKPSG